MKIAILILCICVSGSLVTVSLAAESPQELSTQLQKDNYSIGYQLGIGMAADDVVLEVDALVRGMQDAIRGTDPALSRDEMKANIIEIKKLALERRLRERQVQMVRNAEESKAFMEANARKEGVVVTDSGLQYQVLRAGSGATPTVDDMVTVHYRGTFPDGTEFDSSYAKDEPQVFQTDGVIKGWTEALQKMQVNAKWRLFVPPELAYGRSGLEGRIPPNKVLVFEIELLTIGHLGEQSLGDSGKEPNQGSDT